MCHMKTWLWPKGNDPVIPRKLAMNKTKNYISPAKSLKIGQVSQQWHHAHFPQRNCYKGDLEHLRAFNSILILKPLKISSITNLAKNAPNIPKILWGKNVFYL